MPDLEERVAALEAAMDLSAIPSSWPELTEAEKAGFIEAIGEAKARNQYRLLNAPLSPDEIRQLLSECVTVVKPGETLVVRGQNWTPPQVRGIQQAMDDMYQYGSVPFRALAVPGDELGTALEPEFMAHTRMEPIDGNLVLMVRLTHEPTGVTVAARDRTEGVHKLRKALADRFRRQYDLQEAERRRQRKPAEEVPGDEPTFTEPAP